MSWEVHKFGGASVKDAAGVLNVGRLVAGMVAEGRRLVVVVSAMAKTTNALERVWRALPSGVAAGKECDAVRSFHEEVLEGLGLTWSVLADDWAAFVETVEGLEGVPLSHRGYDATVGFGERFSTRIVHAHLSGVGLEPEWWSAWSLIVTDDRHRAARVQLQATGEALRRTAHGAAARGMGPAVMQGFVGGTPAGVPTTLGREGSDFSGALVAEALQASRLVVWKDVPGVMTGDPRRWPAARRLAHLDHDTAERMGRAGAGVLHPDTMAPLRRAGIPLEVRCFDDPEAPGTVISDEAAPDGLPVLWAFFQDPSGAEWVRCLAVDGALALAEWNANCPDRPMQTFEDDPDVAGCFRLIP